MKNIVNTNKTEFHPYAYEYSGSIVHIVSIPFNVSNCFPLTGGFCFCFFLSFLSYAIKMVNGNSAQK